ncbi:MAG: SO2930 family diheme c-type cytochrome [Pseudohongiellaceae bacterium]
MTKHLGIVASTLLLVACGKVEPVFHASDNPQRLSEWGLFSVTADSLTPVAATEVFTPANQLFSDYAGKLRTLWIPAGGNITLVAGEFDYPVGTVLTKTFYYPLDQSGNVRATLPQSLESIKLSTHRVLETRLLIKRTGGWDALPYIWNDDMSEAFLRIAGGSIPLNINSGAVTSFTYFVPNGNQCAACHVTEHPDGMIEPLGAIVRQLQYLPQRLSAYGGDEDGSGRGNGDESADVSESEAGYEASKLVNRGWLAELPPDPATPSYHFESTDLSTKAAEYLNINCGHCHNPRGAADTSALILNGEHNTLAQVGVCKPPVAAGGGAGDLQYSIVPGAPEQSILLYRMQSAEADEMMPELGRSLIHSEGIQLISDWIANLPGNCGGL